MDNPTFMDICNKIESLQREVIGEPIWREDEQVFEYRAVDIKVVVILKAIRAVQGLRSLELLCRNGLFIDMGAIFRCVTDSEYEIYFLLENYPEQSENVKKFITAFSETTIDNHLEQETEFPLTKKIHSAAVRAMTQSKQDQKVNDMVGIIYKTFCGYIHANYSHIMQSYGGNDWQSLSFNVSGVPSENQKIAYMQLVDEAAKSVATVLGYISLKLTGKR